MANYCKYCGKALVDGICNCQDFNNAQARRAEQEQAAAEQSLTMEAGQTAGVDGSAVIRDLKGILYGFFKDPFQTARLAYYGNSQIAQYLIAAVYAVVIFLSVCILFAASGLKGGGKTAFLAMLIAVAVKMIYAGIAFLFVRRLDTGCSIKKVSGLISVMTIPETILILLILVLGALDLYTFTVIVAAFNSALAVASYLLAVLVMCKGDAKKSYLITLTGCLLVTAIAVVGGKAVMVQMVKSTVGSMFGGF